MLKCLGLNARKNLELFTVEQAARFNLADRIKDEVTDFFTFG